MTTTHLLPPGYDPSVDRVPPRRVGCRSLILLGLLMLVVIGACGGIIFFGIGAANASREETPTPDETIITAEVTPIVDDWSATGTALALITPTDTLQPSPTLDEWQLTGTAFYFITQSPTISPTFSETPSPTLDYCWWLTPTATPSNTPIPVTPDAWSMTGTHVFQLQTTPTEALTPTRQPPRAWCDILPEMTASPIVTYEVFPTFTWHPQPTEVPFVAQPQQQTEWLGLNETYAAPQVYVTSEIIFVTQVQPVQIIVTATPGPTVPNYELTSVWLAMTAFAQMTQSVTATPSNTPTATMTASFTPSWTFSPTHTPTATQTATATATPTLTETPTEATP